METRGNQDDRRWKNRSVVRELDGRRARWLWLMVAGIALAAAPAGAWLVCQNSCLKLSYELNTTRDAHELLLEQERRLRYERARLASLPRIEAWARQKRGLVEPGAGEVVVIRRSAPGAGTLVARTPGNGDDSAQSGSDRR